MEGVSIMVKPYQQQQQQQQCQSGGEVLALRLVRGRVAGWAVGVCVTYNTHSCIAVEIERLPCWLPCVARSSAYNPPIY